MTANHLRDAALSYAARGRLVFPLRARAKVPATARGFHDATTDAAKVAAWWDLWPDANIGCATGRTSGFWSLDIDGDEGEATIRALEAQHGPLPMTVELITGGGGRQVFFRYTAPLGCSVRKLGPGVDSRGDGGYTILPPSVHPSGTPYAWSVDGDPSDVSLAIAPDWLLLALTEAPQRLAKPAEEWRSLTSGGVSEGGRNAAVARLAGHLLRRYVDPYVVLDLIRAWNLAACTPPLPDEEVTITVNSIARREARRREGVAA